MLGCWDAYSLSTTGHSKEFEPRSMCNGTHDKASAGRWQNWVCIFVMSADWKKVPSVLSGATNWSLVCRHCAELIQPDIRQLNGALEDRVIAPDPPTMEMKTKIVLRPCFGTQRVFLFSVDHGQHTTLLMCLKHVTSFCSADAHPMPTLQPRQLFFFFLWA